MRFICKDAEMLEGLLAKVTEKHGSGFRYSHSIGDDMPDSGWQRDLHWFSKAGRVWALASETGISPNTMRNEDIQ